MPTGERRTNLHLPDPEISAIISRVTRVIIFWSMASDDEYEALDFFDGRYLFTFEPFSELIAMRYDWFKLAVYV